MSQGSNRPLPSADAAEPSMDRKSGRIAFDGDGRGIWEWQIDTGVFTRTVTEDQLMDLAATNLQIMEASPPCTERGVDGDQNPPDFGERRGLATGASIEGYWSSLVY